MKSAARALCGNDMSKPVHISMVIPVVFEDIQRMYLDRSRSIRVPKVQANPLQGRELLAELREQIRERGIAVRRTRLRNLEKL